MSSGMGETDETVALLRRWHAGEAGALAVLLGKHLPRLHEFTHRVLDRDFPGLRREQDSLDLVQTAAARVLSYLPRFVPRDGKQFQGLLRTFVRNDLRNQLQSPRRQMRSEGSDSILDLRQSSGSSEMPDRAAEDAEERAWVRLALEFLPDADRLLLHRYLIENSSWEEIARELQMESPDAARMQYKRRAQPRLVITLRRLKAGRVDRLLAKQILEA